MGDKPHDKSGADKGMIRTWTFDGTMDDDSIERNLMGAVRAMLDDVRDRGFSPPFDVAVIDTSGNRFIHCRMSPDPQSSTGGLKVDFVGLQAFDFTTIFRFPC